LGATAARAGDFETAERELAEALPNMVLIPIQHQIVAAELSRVKVALGKGEEGLALARQALEQRESQGGFGQRGTLTRLASVEARDAPGQRGGARAALRRALDELRARAALIEDEVVRRSFLSQVPENARVLALGREWLGEDGA